MLVVWMTLVSYVVPLLFLLSATLAGIRFAYDAAARRNRTLAAVIAVTILAAGLFVIIPLTVRMSSIIGAKIAFRARRWEVAESRYAIFERWGGHLNYRTSFEYGQSLVNQNEYEQAIPLEARAAKDPTGSVSTDANFFLGLSLYKTGRTAEAERVLMRVPAGYHWAPTAIHLVGRIEERRGKADHALWCYARSLKEDPDFEPSLYHYTRLSIRRGQKAAALGVIENSASGHPGKTANGRLILFLRQAVQRGEQLPDHDFF